MTSKQEILAELRRSRAAIARDTASIAEQLDIVSKIRRSVKTRPLAWLGGAAALGYILAGPKTRKTPKTIPTKKGVKSAKNAATRTERRGFFSILFHLAKFLFPLLRPALSAYAAQRLSELSSRIPR